MRNNHNTTTTTTAIASTIIFISIYQSSNTLMASSIPTIPSNEILLLQKEIFTEYLEPLLKIHNHNHNQQQQQQQPASSEHTNSNVITYEDLTSSFQLAVAKLGQTNITNIDVNGKNFVVGEVPSIEWDVSCFVVGSSTYVVSVGLCIHSYPCVSFSTFYLLSFYTPSNIPKCNFYTATKANCLTSKSDSGVSFGGEKGIDGMGQPRLTPRNQSYHS